MQRNNRHHWEDKRKWEPGKTVYSIEPPQGIVGAAYKNRQIVVETGLPPKEDEEAYFQAWLSREYALTREHLGGWGRLPAALLAIPFGTGEDDHDLRGVLCVDFRHSLEAFPQATIRGIAEAIQDKANDGLAWKLLSRRLV